MNSESGYKTSYNGFIGRPEDFNVRGNDLDRTACLKNDLPNGILYGSRPYSKNSSHNRKVLTLEILDYIDLSA